MNIEAVLNEPVFIAVGDTPGLTIAGFSLVVTKDGLVSSVPTPALYEPSPGLYNFSYTFSEPGLHHVFENGSLIATIHVVEKASHLRLKDLEDVAMGSWIWNKQTAKLEFYRQDGNKFAEFDVVEDAQVASRERV